MNNLGDRLKKERENRKLSLDQLAASTRIQKKFLLALEEGRFDALPAGVFVVGFIRSYAAALGLDSDPLIAEYESLRQAAKPAAAPAPRIAVRRRSRNKNLPVLTGVAVVLLLIAGAFQYVKSQKSALHEPLPQLVDEDLVVLSQQAAESEAKKHAQTPEGALIAAITPQLLEPRYAEEKPRQAKPAQPATAAFYMTLTAKDEDVWTYVVIDDEDVRDMYIRAGKTVTVKGNKSFSLTTGNPIHLAVKVNSKSVRIPGSANNKVIRNWLVPLDGR